MKLEDRVCSLELAKKLKTLGVKQESLFWYVVKESSLTKKPVGSLWYWKEKGFSGEEIASAFTVAELGEMLPYTIEKDKVQYFLWCGKMEGWEVSYISGDDINLIVIEEDTEANARAKCLTYLLENGIISKKEME